MDAVALGDPGTGYKFPTVDFDMPDDPNGTIARAHADFDAVTGEITGIVVDQPGSGYSTAPGVVIRDGTLMDPILNGGSGATATATLKVLSVTLDTYGAGYTSEPTVTFGDASGTGSGAAATATFDTGSVTSLNLTSGGSGYLNVGMRKFQDQLPMLCDPTVAGSCPDWQTSPDAKYLPVGVPVEKVYNDANGDPINSDEYQIGLVQYRTKFNSDLPGTLVRGYVQLETPEFVAAHPGVSQHYPLVNADLDRTQPGHPGADRRPAGLCRDASAVARPGHRGHQEQAGAHRLPQPAPERPGGRPLPAGRQHADGLGHGPHGAAR